MSWDDIEALAVRYGLWLTILSGLALLGGLLAMRYAVTYMPADYFTRRVVTDSRWMNQHPAVRWALIIFKNLLGVLLLILGVALLVLPGPGVLLILLGLSLVDVPGKRRLERWLVGIPTVHRKINSLRAKHGQSPLQLPKR